MTAPDFTTTHNTAIEALDNLRDALLTAEACLKASDFTAALRMITVETNILGATTSARQIIEIDKRAADSRAEFGKKGRVIASA